jgi:Sec-independent protein translocase protein TatA
MQDAMHLGLPEIILIALVIVLFVNPKELPGLFRRVGKVFQQVKEMRDSFTKSMKDFENDLKTDTSPAGPAPAREERRPPDAGSGAGRERPARHNRPDGPPPRDRLFLVFKTVKEHDRTAPTYVHVNLGTGMGDRIVFEGVLRHAIQEAGEGARVVSLTYEPGPRYSVPEYTVKPSEIWTLPRQEDLEAIKAVLDGKVREIARARFPEASSLAVVDYNDDSRLVEEPLVRRVELYAHYASTVAPRGIYPEFPLDRERLAVVRDRLARRFPEWGRRPVAAVHVKRAMELPEMNLAIADMQRLCRRLRSKGFLIVLFAGKDDLVQELDGLHDFRCPLDPTLQDPAAVLSLCDVFIGADSGPGHLAAAVGTPVVTLRHPRTPWVNGPFCDPGRLAWVEGALSVREGLSEISFDPEVAASLAAQFIRPDRQVAMAGPSGPLQRD